MSDHDEERTRKIVINPVTRIEGHGKVTIHLDAKGAVEQARFHIVEFRGFERFVQGRLYWEVPVDHPAAVRHLPGQPPSGRGQGDGRHRRRRPAHADRGEDAAADALRPDVPVPRAALLPPGVARPAVRLRLARRPRATSSAWSWRTPKLATKAVLMRKYGQEIIKATAGKKIHGNGAIPGGINKNLSIEERDFLAKDADTMLAWAVEGAGAVQGTVPQGREAPRRVRQLREQLREHRATGRLPRPLRRPAAREGPGRARSSSTR